MLGEQDTGATDTSSYTDSAVSAERAHRGIRFFSRNSGLRAMQATAAGLLGGGILWMILAIVYNHENSHGANDKIEAKDLPRLFVLTAVVVFMLAVAYWKTGKTYCLPTNEKASLANDIDATEFSGGESEAKNPQVVELDDGVDADANNASSTDDSESDVADDDTDTALNDDSGRSPLLEVRR